MNGFQPGFQKVSPYNVGQNIVGDAANPAVYIANDGTWFYVRIRVDVDGPVAKVTMAVDPGAGLRDDYDLKLNYSWLENSEGLGGSCQQSGGDFIDAVFF